MTSARVLPGYFKHIRVFAVAFAFLMVYAVMPLSAHAAGLSSNQIQAVLGLLKSFNVDSETVGAVEAQLQGATTGSQGGQSGSWNYSGTQSGNWNTSGSSTTMPKPPKPEWSDRPDRPTLPGAAMCGQMERMLNRGSQGDDVSHLQDFLQSTGFLHASTTGFFGEVTEHALQNWQAHEGIVNGGDANSTGFGALGPQTRMILMMRCKELNGNHQPGTPGTSGSSTPFATDANAGPVCVLKADKSEIDPGTQVTLYWMSKNATYASSITGDRGPTNGSIVTAPQQTTTYLKKVYDDQGHVGQCMKTIFVRGTTPATDKSVVIVPTPINLSRVFSLMGDGMAAVMDGYLSLFGLSME